MYNSNFDVNILVKGNRCKIYHHSGKSYIESKHGSEYELEIKNNTINRVVVVASIDGLNVLNGAPASHDGPGYIIPSYSPLKIKGFRYSNEEVAAFKFTSKENSYAQFIGGEEFAQNCGIIGIIIFNELVKTPTVIYNYEPVPVSYQHPNPWYHDPFYVNTFGGIKCSTTDYNEPVLKDFDMGSTWGQKVESLVQEADFERGNIIFSTDIYYASRESLSKMGVNINAPPQVSFPQSFPNKYAKPPSGWKG